MTRLIRWLDSVRTPAQFFGSTSKAKAGAKLLSWVRYGLGMLEGVLELHERAMRGPEAGGNVREIPRATDAPPE